MVLRTKLVRILRTTFGSRRQNCYMLLLSTIIILYMETHM